MVILHVLAPAPTGGLERVVQSLTAGLADRRHEVHVAVIVNGGPSATHPFVEPLLDSGVKVHFVRVGNREYLREREGVRALCRQLRPAVVHTHGYRPDMVDAPVPRTLGIPTVTTVHGFTGGGLRNRVYETLQRRAFRNFSAVVAVSRPLSDQLVQSGVPATRLRLIQNAWSGPAKWLDGADARRQLGIESDAFQVGWVGRLSREKGPDVLLAALSGLSDVPLEVNFLGDGPERAGLEALATRSTTRHRVRWLGNTPRAETMFKAFDAFVLSSRTEGTPMVLFEAMAAGVPIVATCVGGVPDVIDESCALLIPPQNPVALASAIRSLRDDAAGADSRARVARDRVETRFARDAWVGRYEALYHELRN